MKETLRFVGVYEKHPDSKTNEINLITDKAILMVNCEYMDEDFQLFNNEDDCDLCELLRILLPNRNDIRVSDIYHFPIHSNHFDGFNTKFGCVCDDVDCPMKKYNVSMTEPKKHEVNDKEIIVYHKIEVILID